MSVLSATTAKKVEELLIARSQVSADQLESARKKSSQSGKSLLAELVEESILSNENLVKLSPTLRMYLTSI